MLFGGAETWIPAQLPGCGAERSEAEWSGASGQLGGNPGRSDDKQQKLQTIDKNRSGATTNNQNLMQSVYWSQILAFGAPVYVVEHSTNIIS